MLYGPVDVADCSLCGPLLLQCLVLAPPAVLPQQHFHKVIFIKAVLLNVSSASTKTFSLNFISTAALDVLFLTETWLDRGEYSQHLDLWPPNYKFLSSIVLNFDMTLTCEDLNFQTPKPLLVNFLALWTLYISHSPTHNYGHSLD